MQLQEEKSEVKTDSKMMDHAKIEILHQMDYPNGQIPNVNSEAYDL